MADNQLTWAIIHGWAICITSAMEIPCPTWSHFIQDKFKNFYLCVLGQVQMYKLIQFCISYINYYELTYCIENCVDPDQLASEEARSQLIWI